MGAHGVIVIKAFPDARTFQDIKEYTQENAPTIVNGKVAENSLYSALPWRYIIVHIRGSGLTFVNTSHVENLLVM